MITHLKDKIRKPINKLNLMAQLTSLETEPKTVTQALKDPKWRHAMDSEFNALLKNNSWDLVPPCYAENVISTKLVFRLKRDSKVILFNIRLVLLLVVLINEKGSIFMRPIVLL